MKYFPIRFVTFHYRYFSLHDQQNTHFVIRSVLCHIVSGYEGQIMNCKLAGYVVVSLDGGQLHRE